MEDSASQTRNISYPAVAFSAPSIMDICKDEEDLTKCNRTALKNGYFDNLRIVDSRGRSYIVKNARKVGTVGLLWGLNLFRGQQIRVELNVSISDAEISIDEMISLVDGVFKADEYFWNSGGNLHEIKVALSNSRSISEIIQILVSVMSTKFAT